MLGWPTPVRVLGWAEVMAAVPPGGVGGTTVGNPPACAAALTVLEAVDQEVLCQRAESLGQRMLSHLQGLAARCPRVDDVRGRAAMAAIELGRDAIAGSRSPSWPTRRWRPVCSGGCWWPKRGGTGTSSASCHRW